MGAIGWGGAAMFLVVGAAASQEEAAPVVRSVVRVADENVRLALVDVDGDGDDDLVLIADDGVAVRQLGDDGAYAEWPARRVAWPSVDIAWTLADVDGDDAIELVVFVGAREVRTISLAGEGATEVVGGGKLELVFEGVLPRGNHRMDFCRDVDGDGFNDFVLPGFGSYALHLRQPGGSYAEPIQIAFETETSYQIGSPNELDGSFGQAVTVPWFSLEDVDGDGDQDLLSETSDEVLVHLANPVLENEPTWRLDKAALRDELPEDEGINFSDLLSMATRQTEWRIVDLDGVVPNDLVIQVDGKFRVYLGGAATGMTGVPDQVLKASGNVLWFFLRNVEGDDLPELHILRGEKISLARVIRWLVLPGDLDFDLFSYENQSRASNEGVFSRRPTRRVTLTLEIPRLFSFMNELSEAEEAGEADDIPARRVALDSDGLRDDILDMRNGELLAFAGRAPGKEGVADQARANGVLEAFESYLVSDIDTLEDGNTKTFDLSKITKLTEPPGAGLRAACDGVEPDIRVPLVPGCESGSIHARDLNGDGRDDWIVIARQTMAESEADEETWLIQLLVRPKL